MKKIMVNETLIFLRHKYNYVELDDIQSDVLLSKDKPDNNLLLEEYYELIRELPYDLRTIFNLYAIEGYSHKEIAKQLNIQESSSRVYLTRARKILQKNLTKNF